MQTVLQLKTISLLATLAIVLVGVAPGRAGVAGAPQQTLAVGSQTFAPVADSYTSSAAPATNYGTSTSLRVDADPVVRSFLRFNVQGLAGPVATAKLRIFAKSSQTASYDVRAVADNTWGETTITNGNAPAFSSTVTATSGPVAASTWVQLDITPLIAGNGLRSLALTTPGTTALSMASRESTTPPQLVITEVDVTDLQPPTTPTGLSATATSATRVDLSWTASSDDVGVAGYTVLRDGVGIATVGGSSTSYSDTSAVASTNYAYTVDAFDAAGHHSEPSVAASVTTPAPPPEQSFVPVADAYTSASLPATNYGRATTLRVDGSPILRSYVRFDLGSLAGSIVSARLRIFVKSTSSSGYNVYGVADNSWGETTITYNNAPSFAATPTASSGAITSGTWTEVVVTPLVTGAGLVSFGLATPSSTSKTFASRESGATAPQLVVTTGSPADREPPTTPADFVAVGVSDNHVSLAWGASTDNVAVTGYRLQRDGSTLTTLGAATLSYEDLTVSAAVPYAYTLVALDAAGNASVAAGPVTVTPPDTQPPTTPGNLKALPLSASQINLAWSAATDNVGVTAYAVSRDGVPLVTLDGGTLSYLDIGLTASTTYAYAVEAVDGSGNRSLPTTPVTATTFDTQPPGADPVLAVAGDIACGAESISASCKQMETSNLLLQINPTAVAALGDVQYEDGQYSNFIGFYDPSWGRVKSITYPVLGNHEYGTPGAAGYFDYYNGVGNLSGPAGDRDKAYYSADLGAWHVVVLNSNCSRIVGGCAAGGAQEAWLRADLAAHPAACTIGLMHHPLYSSGGRDTPATRPLYQAMYDYGVDVVLTGHDHTYERFAPQDANGNLDLLRGFREFVVGTGGRNHTHLATPFPNSEVFDDTSFGVLKLTLRTGGYDWAFVPIPGNTFTDSGTATCN